MFKLMQKKKNEFKKRQIPSVSFLSLLRSVLSPVATTDRETETAAAAEEEVTSHAILDHTAEVEVEADPVALTVDRHHPARTATFKTTIHSYDSLQFLCVSVLCFYL